MKQEILYWLDKKLGVPLWALLVFLPLILENRLDSAGRTAADSLLIGVGARPAALAGAYTALANDPFATAYNPAGIAQLLRPELALMHNEWVGGIQQQFGALALPTSLGAFGLSINRVDFGEFAGRDNNGQQTQNFKGGDFSAGISFARPLSRNILAGFQLKYIQESLAGYAAQTFAADGGFIVHLPHTHWQWGFALQNIGPGITFIQEAAPLPTTLSVGTSYNLGGIRLVGDFKQRLTEKKTDLAFGFELAPPRGVLQPLCFRLGYGAVVGRPMGLDALGGGFGLKLGNTVFDYAFKPFGILGETHRFSLNVKF